MGSCSKVSGGSYMKKGGNMCGSKVGGSYHEEKKGGMGCGSKKRGGDQYDEGSFMDASKGSTSTLSSSADTKPPEEASKYLMGGKKRRKRKTKRVKKVRRKTAKKSFLARLFKL